MRRPLARVTKRRRPQRHSTMRRRPACATKRRRPQRHSTIRQPLEVRSDVDSIGKARCVDRWLEVRSVRGPRRPWASVAHDIWGARGPPRRKEDPTPRRGPGNARSRPPGPQGQAGPGVPGARGLDIRGAGGPPGEQSPGPARDRPPGPGAMLARGPRGPGASAAHDIRGAQGPPSRPSRGLRRELKARTRPTACKKAGGNSRRVKPAACKTVQAGTQTLVRPTACQAGPGAKGPERKKGGTGVH